MKGIFVDAWGKYQFVQFYVRLYFCYLVVVVVSFVLFIHIVDLCSAQYCVNKVTAFTPIYFVVF